MVGRRGRDEEERESGGERVREGQTKTDRDRETERKRHIQRDGY